MGGLVGVDCTDNFFRKTAIEKTILRIVRPSAFSHGLDPTLTRCPEATLDAPDSAEERTEQSR
jgi:hypothetical protein